MSDRRYDGRDLGAWMSAVLQTCGVSTADAAIASGVLLRTSLRGIDTHGVARLPSYVARLKAGEMNPRAVPRCTWAHGALRVDGDLGLGQVVASVAVRQAIERTNDAACVSVLIENSGHLSALGVLLLGAVEQGRVALLCQRTGPIMSMPGALAPAIGNNPIAFVAPMAGAAPLVFDMASSVVARGHVMQAHRDGQAIPEDWALGPDGMPTRDAAQALQGMMRAVGGHKGIGLAMVVECLCALAGNAAAVGGSAAADRAGSAAGVAAFLLVLNPALVAPAGAIDVAMRAWLDRYLEASGKSARYPGQRQARCEAERSSRGVPLSFSVERELRDVGAATGVAFDLPAMA